MEIKDVYSYQTSNEKPYIAMGFISGMIFMGFGLISAACFAFVPDWLGLCSLLVGLTSAIVCFSLGTTQEQRRDDIARNEYRKLPLELLKKGAESKELSDHTRYVITSLLNDEFKGWSFQ